MFRKSMWTDIIVYSISILLAVAGLVFGAWDPLWRATGLDRDLRPGMTMAASVVVLLAGHYLAVVLRESALAAKIEDSFDAFSRTMTSSLHGVEALVVFQTSDDAMNYLTSRLPKASKVWNTRITVGGIGDYSTAASKRYAHAVEQAIIRGVFFREVVGSTFANRAADLRTAGQSRGYNYDYTKIADPSSPMFNFIIIEDDHGEREILFGWVITPSHGFEQNCFKSRNGHLVGQFMSIHGELMSRSFQGVASKAVSQSSVTTP
jgi:hypothetical protein